MPREAAHAFAAGQVVDERHAPPVRRLADDLVPENRARGRPAELLDVRAAEPAREDVDELPVAAGLGDLGERRLPGPIEDDRAHRAELYARPRRILRAVAERATQPYSTRRVDVVRLPGAAVEGDAVAVEEPLEIRVNGVAVAVTMRTPGDDEELALGFCVTEGLRPREARLPADLAANTVEVDADDFDPARLQRSFYTTSSCGVCGKGALEAIAVEAKPVDSRVRVRAELVAELPDRLQAGQATFAATGGLHATGLFASDGTLACLREDVGRHNAMDKVIGWAHAGGRLPLADSILCVSGRVSFELVQKAAVAGCPILVAVGAPSSLAVELAAAQRITLCGFARGDRVNVYTEAWRVEA